MEEEKTLEIKPRIYTVKRGTNFYSGVYPEAGQWLGKAKEDMKIGVYIDKRLVKRSRETGWIFFPTTHEVPYENRTIPAWVAKTSWKQRGFVKR